MSSPSTSTPQLPEILPETPKRASSSARSSSEIPRLQDVNNEDEEQQHHHSSSSRLRPRSSRADDLEDGEEENPNLTLHSDNSPTTITTTIEYSSASSYTSDSSNPASPIQPTNLFPPFYNRPPTPLPPSPSLTSLLLPRRATTPIPTVASPPSDTSPPFSPFASDSEILLPHQPHPHHRLTLPHHPHLQPTINTTTTSTGLCATDLSLAESSHIAFHTPRASPKVPTYEYYGFVLYLGSTLCFLVYILWSYLPSSVLHALGIHYYPSRWWSLALPSWLVMLLVYIYVALAAYNTGHMTVKLGAVEGVVDNAAKVAGLPELEVWGEKDGVVREGGGGGKRRWRMMWDHGTDGVIDVPIGGVCEVLYGEDRDLEDWEVGDS